MDWKDLIKQARKAIEAGDLETADKLKEQATRIKALDAMDEPGAEEQPTEEETKATDTTAKINRILEYIEDSPAIRKSGYFTEDGGAADKKVKSFGDYLLAIQRNDTKRLMQVYKSTKDMSSTSGGGGGYLVPEEFSTALLNIMNEESPILSRCFRQPVTAPSGRYPSLDMFTAPTAGSGNTAMSGGLTPATVVEGAAYGEDEPLIELLQYNVNKIGEVVDVPVELMDDSAIGIETLLRRLFAIAMNSKVERHVLRGSGVGEPLGIMNANCAVAVTTASDNAFAEADALAMFARFKEFPGSNAVWIMHRGVIPDFSNFTSSNSDLVEWRQQMPNSMLGYPILYSEHSPQDDNAGDVILADLGAYIIFDRKQLTIGFSEHAKFENDLVVWKYNVRLDGMPWLRNTITLADPTGSYTVSPFVYHND